MDEPKTEELSTRRFATVFLRTFGIWVLIASVAIPVAVAYWHPLGAPIPMAVRIIGAALGLVSLALAYLLRKK